jgi:hypothetical protein
MPRLFKSFFLHFVHWKMKQFVQGEFSRPAAIWNSLNPYLLTKWTLNGKKASRRFTELQLKKGRERKGKNKSRASKKVNRGAARNSRRNRGSAKCRLEFPQGMSRNGTPSRADAISFLGLPRKRIVSNKLGISHNGHSPALCWLRRPESNVDWHRPPALFLRVIHHPKESPRIVQPEPPRAS